MLIVRAPNDSWSIHEKDNSSTSFYVCPNRFHGRSAAHPDYSGVMAIDSSRVNLIMTQSVLGPYFLAVDSLDVTHPALAGVRNTPLGSSLAL